MPLHLDSFKNNPPIEISQNFTISGLETFLNLLEKDFFSRTTVYQCKSASGEIKLVLELICDMSLAELLFHFNREAWGHFRPGESTLSIALDILNGVNLNSIEIEELSILLKDTTIVIDRIYKNSIPEQLQEILIELGNHYVHLTNGLKEVPYEIYMPVFEGKLSLEYLNSYNELGEKITPKDYYNYWGLYFESEEDALIYDLPNISIIPGDLYMLNH